MKKIRRTKIKIIRTRYRINIFIPSTHLQQITGYEQSVYYFYIFKISIGITRNEKEVNHLMKRNVLMTK